MYSTKSLGAADGSVVLDCVLKDFPLYNFRNTVGFSIDAFVQSLITSIATDRFEEWKIQRSIFPALRLIDADCERWNFHILRCNIGNFNEIFGEKS